MRVLIVDDDYVSRVKLASFFNSLGQSDCAPRGDIAVSLFEEAHKELVPYDLVTVDIEMPGIHGQEVVDKMRQIERTLEIEASNQVKILMVTAKTAIKEVSSSYNKGCDGYLTKPATPEELRRSLKDLGVAT